MTNYDYNRGYRGFKFKKDNKIDRKLPALTNYLSLRQSSSIHWVANTKRRPFQLDTPNFMQQNELIETEADLTNSIVYFPRIGSTLGGQLVANNSYLPDEDSMEGLVERYSLAPVNTAATMSVRGGLEHRKTPYLNKLPRESKSRKQTRHRNLRKSQKDIEEYKRNEKLKECLVIHNGVERGERDDLLTKEKKNDIMDWMEKMPA